MADARVMGAMEKGRGSRSRGAFRPGFAKISPSSKTEGAGKAGCRSHPRSCAQSARVDHEATGSSGFPRATVYGLFRAHPGETMLCCHRRLADGRRIHEPGWADTSPQDLTPAFGASGRHDFAVRACLAKALAGPRTYPASFNEDSFKRRSFARRLIAHGVDPALPSLARPTLRVHRIPCPTSVRP